MNRELQAAVVAELARRGGGSLRAGTSALSGHYRAGGRSDHTIDLSAYLTARLPATFAAVSNVLAEVVRQRPGFMPKSLIDAGSGPGTASWAAASTWPGLRAITLIDSNSEFLALAGRLASHSSCESLCSARLQRGDMLRFPEIEQADLVIAAYALAELPIAKAGETARLLWRTAGQMLVLVEPGTPAGFARLKAVRAELLGLGAIPVAPCTHGEACPVSGSDWCHFSVRLARSRAHMHAKGASVPFEDEKFSYLALGRAGLPSGGGRVLAPPLDRKPGLIFKLCKPEGIEMRDIARRDSTAYKSARKTGWGDHLA